MARLTQKRVWVERPLGQGELDIYWIPKPFTGNLYPIGYNIYRSTQPTTVLTAPGLVKLNTTPVQIPMFRDLTVNTKAFDHLYYLITELLSDSSEHPIDAPTTLYHTLTAGTRSKNISMPRIFAEYRRRKYILLRDNAENVDFLIRRQSGDRCECYSGEYEQATRGDCPLCYGTGWLRGYELLRCVKCRVLSIKETLQLQPQGLQLKSGPTAWLVDFPLLRNGDVLVRMTGERYEVNSVSYTVHQGCLTHQDFDLKLIEPTHSIYSYDIPLSDGA